MECCRTPGVFDFDHFRFTLDGEQTVTIETSHADLAPVGNGLLFTNLFDAAGSRLDSRRVARGSTSTIEQVLPAGTCYIVLDPNYEEVSEYTMTFRTR